MKIIKKKLSDLIPAEYNPRKISDIARRGLKKSIEMFGLTVPLVYNARNNTIISGHQRAIVLKEMYGDIEVDVVEVDLDDEKEKALNIAMNSQEISGDFTSDLSSMIAEFESDLISSLNFDLIKIPSFDKEKPVKEIDPVEEILYPEWIVIRFEKSAITKKEIMKIIKNLTKIQGVLCRSSLQKDNTDGND